MAEFKTKKAARAAELKTAKEWFSHYPAMVPKRDATGVAVKGESFFFVEECEEVLSATGAGARGLIVPRDAEPVGEKFRGRPTAVYYDVYRLSDCTAKRVITKRPPRAIDLLLAIFTVTKAAKRYRDAAFAHYRADRHGFATHAQRTKENLYRLKDRGIAQAYQEGRLSFEGIYHRLGLYRGDGYCFHSTIIPRDRMDAEALDEQEWIHIVASPKGSREGRLKDAKHTLSSLSDQTGDFDRCPAPGMDYDD